MKKNVQGFAIVLALGFMILLSLLGLYLIEYMVPFSRNVSGIENSSKAFYQSYGALEESIYRTYEGGIGFEPPEKTFTSGTPIDMGYSVTSSGSTIPEVGRGSSPFNNNWNIISQNAGINLFIGNGIFSSPPVLKVEFMVPDFDNNSSVADVLQSPDNIILWQLSDGNDSLTSKELIDIPATLANIFLDNTASHGFLLDGVTQQYFSNFYSNNCASTQCVLRFSIVNPLISINGAVLPYLQYQIMTNATTVIPFQESYISALGRSNGFKKELEVVLPHPVTNSAFDFTVLQ